nr:MAG TPA: NifU-like protein [Bacteriophage sp.]
MTFRSLLGFVAVRLRRSCAGCSASATSGTGLPAAPSP